MNDMQRLFRQAVGGIPMLVLTVSEHEARRARRQRIIGRILDASAIMVFAIALAIAIFGWH